MQFHPEKSLFELRIVRRTLYVTGIVAIVVALLIAINTKLVFSFTDTGFNEAVKMFQVPLGIIAIGFTLIGIYGANHRSEQTRRQIERNAEQIRIATEQMSITEGQNKFSNFYKHVEEFTKYCQSHGDKKIYANPRKLYSKIFAESRNGKFSVSEEFYDNIVTFMESFVRYADLLDNASTYSMGLAKLVTIRTQYSKKNGINDMPDGNSGAQITYGGEMFIIPNGSAQALIKSLYRNITVIDTALSFDLDYVSPPMFKALSRVKFEYIPESNISDMQHYFKFSELVSFYAILEDEIRSR